MSNVNPLMQPRERLTDAERVANRRELAELVQKLGSRLDGLDVSNAPFTVCHGDAPFTLCHGDFYCMARALMVLSMEVIGLEDDLDTVVEELAEAGEWALRANVAPRASAHPTVTPFDPEAVERLKRERVERAVDRLQRKIADEEARIEAEAGRPR